MKGRSSSRCAGVRRRGSNLGNSRWFEERLAAAEEMALENPATWQALCRCEQESGRVDAAASSWRLRKSAESACAGELAATLCPTVLGSSRAHTISGEEIGHTHKT